MIGQLLGKQHIRILVNRWLNIAGYVSVHVLSHFENVSLKDFEWTISSSL